jgi:hypothetical protein
VEENYTYRAMMNMSDLLHVKAVHHQDEYVNMLLRMKKLNEYE